MCRDQRGYTIRERHEIVVLRHKISLGVELNDRTRLAIGTHVDRDHALGRDPACSLARLVTELDAKQFLSSVKVTTGLGQCLFALHHRSISFFSKRFYQGCGDFSHLECFLNAWRVGGDNDPRKSGRWDCVVFREFGLEFNEFVFARGLDNVV